MIGLIVQGFVIYSGRETMQLISSKAKPTSLGILLLCWLMAEEELLKNAKAHAIKEHGYTEETWNEKMSKDQEKLKKLIKSS